MQQTTSRERRVRRLESYFGSNNATVRTLRAQILLEKEASEKDKSRATERRWVGGCLARLF